MRLVQLMHRDGQRRVASVQQDQLVILVGPSTIYHLAQYALQTGRSLHDAARHSEETVDYDAIYQGQGDWRILPPIDHPDEPARCQVTGTGLTHKASALNRNAMHEQGQQAAVTETDSMKMFRWGLEGGHPAEGQVGTAPEWFYKGNGTILKAHREPLLIPPHAEDGGEEPEIAGVYLIDAQGQPRRLGMAQGNEFSDHKFEKRNYLYLAHSKLRTCSLGPELIVNPDFSGEVPGTVTIERAGAVLWQKAIHSGEKNMCHSLANMEHHHFKYALHRRAGDVHVHYFGADAFSFGEGITLKDGDVMQVAFTGFGRPLRNTVRVNADTEKLTVVTPL